MSSFDNASAEVARLRRLEAQLQTSNAKLMEMNTTLRARVKAEGATAIKAVANAKAAKQQVAQLEGAVRRLQRQVHDVFTLKDQFEAYRKRMAKVEDEIADRNLQEARKLADQIRAGMARQHV